jgi:hypothetical protein
MLEDPRLARRTVGWRATPGLTVVEFDNLACAAVPALEAAQAHLSRPRRRRAIGAMGDLARVGMRASHPKGVGATTRRRTSPKTGRSPAGRCGVIQPFAKGALRKPRSSSSIGERAACGASSAWYACPADRYGHFLCRCYSLSSWEAKPAC